MHVAFRAATVRRRVAFSMWIYELEPHEVRVSRLRALGVRIIDFRLCSNCVQWRDYDHSFFDKQEVDMSPL